MMTDFAIERERPKHIPPAAAIAEAASVRFRPIMMTTVAAIVGTLPIAIGFGASAASRRPMGIAVVGGLAFSQVVTLRSEEHTSELQSHSDLVCRLLLEKKKN